MADITRADDCAALPRVLSSVHKAASAGCAQAGRNEMRRVLRAFLATGVLLVIGSNPALAQKSGGILKIQHWDTPASMSIHEEATYSVVTPIMGVFNNLVMYKQDVAQNSLQSIVPDLAES